MLSENFVEKSNFFKIMIENRWIMWKSKSRELYRIWCILIIDFIYLYLIVNWIFVSFNFVILIDIINDLEIWRKIYIIFDFIFLVVL